MKQNIYTTLARNSIKYYLTNHQVMVTPPNLPNQLTLRAGTFVSLHIKGSGELRGCIGTFLPTRTNLAEEIIYNAIAAALEVPRFPPVNLRELAQIEISVDVLSEPKSAPIGFKFNPKKYGLIVCSSFGRRGLLLPDIEGVESFEEQERICRLKAGIGPEEKVTYQYFTVRRFKES